MAEKSCPSIPQTTKIVGSNTAALRADLEAVAVAARDVIAVGAIPHSNQLQRLLAALARPGVQKALRNA